MLWFLVTFPILGAQQDLYTWVWWWFSRSVVSSSWDPMDCRPLCLFLWSRLLIAYLISLSFFLTNRMSIQEGSMPS